ncbi:MAG: phosphoribosylglycinamide formyltransferase [Anaerolineales bacterium]|nr:phosphoribosylglycinamide formyltransferase [Anaerolineales bacterium]
MNLAFFASHNGSDMQAVVDACKSGTLRATPCVVFSNNSGSMALVRAGQEHIPAYHLSSKTHPDPARLDRAMLDILTRHQTDWIILAGYLKKLGPQVINAYRGRILNIHPALLPKYGGYGMYGAAVHAAVLAAGETETGVTIHQVDETFDHGSIIAQCKVPVQPGDTLESLAERVLRREHAFLVETLQRMENGEMGTTANPVSPFPEVKTLLDVLLRGVREVLGDNLVGFYLDGSLTGGDFDSASDIDFIAVTEAEVTPAQFSALQAMHGRVAATDPRWGSELEGSYISRAAVRRWDPALSMHPNLERGKGECLKMVPHEEDWIIHYHVVRERGIPLFGPDPKTLIDPVSPDDLRRAMRPCLEKWWRPMLADPAPLMRTGYQTYAVLTMCRICYTLATGEVASKTNAVRWAKAHLDRHWSPLIDRALEARRNPDPASSREAIAETQEFIRFVIGYRPQAPGAA